MAGKQRRRIAPSFIRYRLTPRGQHTNQETHRGNDSERLPRLVMHVTIGGLGRSTAAIDNSAFQFAQLATGIAEICGCPRAYGVELVAALIGRGLQQLFGMTDDGPEVIQFVVCGTLGFTGHVVLLLLWLINPFLSKLGMLELASITPIAATPFQNKWPQKKGVKFRIRTSDRLYSPFSRFCPVSAQKPAVSFYKRKVSLSLFKLNHGGKCRYRASR